MNGGVSLLSWSTSRTSTPFISSALPLSFLSPGSSQSGMVGVGISLGGRWEDEEEKREGRG